MRNQAGIFTLLVEDDTVSTRAATSVDFERAQDRELLVRAVNREVEALVVVVSVRVAVQLTAGLVLGVALVQSIVNVGLPVADAAAGLDAAVASLDDGGGLRRGGEEEEGSGNLLYFISTVLAKQSVHGKNINTPG